MTLSDGISVGDQVMASPSWGIVYHGEREPVQPARVIYVHPDGRYYTIKYSNGLTDTIQTAPPERLAHPLPDGYGLQNNRYVRDRIRGLRVSQRELGKALGHTQSWMNRKLSDPLSAKEQQEIIKAAEKIAAERSRT